LLPGCLAGEEENALHFVVVQEVVEGPDTALLPERVTTQVWVVAESRVHGG